MAPSELLQDAVELAVERVVLAGHLGKSGAGLERVRLADGRTLVVKRLTPESDFTLAMTGGTIGRECLLWQDGVLDRLPPGVGHAVVGAWLDGDATVIAMRDLGSCVLTWGDRVPAASAEWMAERVARLHHGFLGTPPSGLASLGSVIGIFAPHRIAPLAAAGNELCTLALRGWELFAELVPADVADPVLAVLIDPAPLVDALLSGPVTLCHGDLATVNMAIEGDTLTLLDWAMPVAAPGAFDVARFVAGCSQVIDVGREEFIDLWARAAGDAHDERSLRLALLVGVAWLGWNKALDAAEHPDPATRAREQQDLDWWVGQARRTLESGAL